ncbi:hypothetical protein DY000_02030005 [Brassica cretica]|uniref:Uncharacterized protein n=1 Tax=Brassica cretica TaxID=69181 RepID=A0ABQ7DF25_BRACR|nr:hypothetical protein DY000_02030005 [Brassica cretica]
MAEVDTVEKLANDLITTQLYKCMRQLHDSDPIGDPRDEDVAEEVRNKVLMPPVTKRPAGRRKTKRFLSTGEIPGPNKKAIPNRCGRCRGTWHNRTN